MNLPIVTNIQKYSIHDGEGIRTTVFFKGCPLSCKWCHNPETQKYEKELSYYKDKCVGCLSCIEGCQNNAIYNEGKVLKLDKDNCMACGNCVDYCIYNAREVIGKTYEIQELVQELEKDFMFYEESNGGITLSGGEVMAQDIDYIENLVRLLHEKGHDIAIDTCGYVTYDRFKRIIPYINTVLYDIKIMDSDLHKKYTGRDNKIILDNLKELSKEKVCIYLRLPLIDKINSDNNSILKIIYFLKENNIKVDKINLLPYHDTAIGKYCRLGLEYDEVMKAPSQDRLEEILDLFCLNGFKKIKIGG